MAAFDVYVEGVEDPFLVDDPNFQTADEAREHLVIEANRFPKWVQLGDLVVFSARIQAIVEADLGDDNDGEVIPLKEAA